MKYTLPLFLFVLFCTACHSTHTEETHAPVNKPASLETDTVSHYHEYRIEPDIYDIQELRDLLNRADKVLAYNFNKNNGNPASPGSRRLYEFSSHELCATATNRKELTPAQKNKLIKITCDTTTYTGEWSGITGTCFIPHIGFGFFENDTFISQINVCFLCDFARTQPYYRSDFLSPKGIKRYRNFAQELGLNIVDHSSDLSY